MSRIYAPVVNFDLPYDPEMYMYRIGRTGSSGKEGVALEPPMITISINGGRKSKIHARIFWERLLRLRG
jgi:hypothetical protein